MTGKMPLYQARKIAQSLIDDLKVLPYVVGARITGSARRWVDEVSNINIACAIDPKAAGKVKRWLGERGELQRAATQDYAPVRLEVDGQKVSVDVGLCGEQTFGALTMYMTGSPQHNALLRRTFDMLRLSYLRHGVFDMRGKRLAGPVEGDVYRALGAQYHPPEIRENGVFRPLPKLVNKDNLPTVVSPPTMWSKKGGAEPKDVIAQAIEDGRGTVLFADSLLKLQGQLNSYTRHVASLAHLHAHKVNVVAGVRVPIEMDGRTHVPRDENLDLIVASIDDTPINPVNRITKAIKLDPRIRVVTKVTGRVLGRIEVPDSPWENLFRAAIRHQVVLAISADPKRMDPPPDLVKLGRDMGCRFIIDGGTQLTYGLKVARKALLSPRDVATREFISG